MAYSEQIMANAPVPLDEYAGPLPSFKPKVRSLMHRRGLPRATA